METPRQSIDGPTMQHYLRKGHVERALATRALFTAAGQALRSWLSGRGFESEVEDDLSARQRLAADAAHAAE